LLELGNDSRLLDVACGMGTQDIYLFHHFGPLQIVAVDVTWKHIQQGIRRARDGHCERQVLFRHGSATRLPFASGSFTHVMSIEGPEHFDTRETFFREAFRVLAPGGVMALADYTLKRMPRNRWEKLMIEAVRALWKVPRANLDSGATYREKLSRSGFPSITIS